MVEAYNFYLGGFLPKVSPKTNVHNRRELKSKYKNIVSLNNTNPLFVVKMSNDTQTYALNVKEMSMELGEAAQNVLDGRDADAGENAQKMTDLFNKLLDKSDEFGERHGRPSRPGGELRNLVDHYTGELIEAGYSVDGRGYLKAPDVKEGETSGVPEKFASRLIEKCEHMNMNPMEYVDQKVYSYAHLYRSDIGSSYTPSLYSGMLFNSYC